MGNLKHSVLPLALALGSPELANWIRSNSIETFQHTLVEYLTDEEVREFEHESSKNGREFNRLNDIVKKIGEIVKKGTEKELTFKIPITVGTKRLDAQRRQNDDFLETGSVTENIEIHCIPDVDKATMEFFDLEGNNIADRSRPMSISERNRHVGALNQLYIKKQDNGDIVDESTGDVLKSGTHD